MIITQQVLQDTDLCDYYHQGNQITWYGYKAGVLDIETVAGTYSLELPCSLDTESVPTTEKAMKYIVTIPTSPDWQALCGNLSAVGVEKMKARILEETGIQTEWTPCVSPKGYWVRPADLLALLTV